tara:strand:- start:99 stop:287 length:189 start_codon:yes stop_codon:yes gene_type:complete
MLVLTQFLHTHQLQYHHQEVEVLLVLPEVPVAQEEAAQEQALHPEDPEIQEVIVHQKEIQVV